MILAPTRWKLRKGIKVVNQVMAELRVEKHPDKTFIGRIAKGFDFLGYWFSPQGLGVAKKTVERMVDKVFRLYEQGADELRIETYLNHWWRWVRSGVDGVSLFGFGLVLYLALTQPSTEAYAFRRVGWANSERSAISSGIIDLCPPYMICVRTESLAISSGIMSICPPYKISVRTLDYV
ncbi:hypothetical protein BJP34_14665 [Moorena producens PAL-8-15-08-1]|uniref:Reverse transcriptase domain-containing protein n=1 Tax=Moorena producens PAL-8-15-08-1 TaxID=1458985 RepID=A0A1D8TSV3_9CYAN|nr:hypothetical protein [Moorena producens]AOX00526.1 hypothetical protein BJP34_14665 [Moorena producens PAL-8-15-08-1]